eukprot:20594_1
MSSSLVYFLLIIMPMVNVIHCTSSSRQNCFKLQQLMQRQHDSKLHSVIYPDPEMLTSQLMNQMDTCLNSSEPMETRLFNQFLNELIALNTPINPKTITAIDSYYNKLLKHNIIPTIFTFNTLLKAVRLTKPARHSYASGYLNAMISIRGIEPDVVTITELLGMCAKAPNDPSAESGRTNKDVAQFWFHWYLDHLWSSETLQQRGKAILVFTQYLNVFAQTGDLGGMSAVRQIMYDKNIQLDKPWRNTWKKGMEIAAKRRLIY